MFQFNSVCIKLTNKLIMAENFPNLSLNEIKKNQINDIIINR